MCFDWYGIDWNNEEYLEVKERFSCYAKIKLLSAEENKKEAKKKHLEALCVKPEDSSQTQYQALINNERELMRNLGLLNAANPIDILPPGSFFLKMPFILNEPYASKDDESFYISENPLRKDVVFKVPMASASGLKGALRWVAHKNLRDSLLNNELQVDAIQERCRIVRLFGTEKGGIEEVDSEKMERELDNLMGEEKTREFRNEVRDKRICNKLGMSKGCLYFYPVFFDQIGMLIINPHNRKKKAGTQPIDIEYVPSMGKGEFCLMYSSVQYPKMEKELIQKDWKDPASWIHEMFTLYGFSAKKTSGLGIIRDTLPSQGKFYYRDFVTEEKHECAFNKASELSNIIPEVL
jgi:CRISPR-associated protein Cmr2